MDTQHVIVKCVVAARNSNGESDFYFVKIECTEPQKAEGAYEATALAQAELQGYEPKLVFVEGDPGWAVLEGLFVWESASTVVLPPEPPRKLVNGEFQVGDKVCYSARFLSNINDYSAASAELTGTIDRVFINPNDNLYGFVIVKWGDEAFTRMVRKANVIHASLKHLEPR
jgi:hypothetical protein